MLWRRSAPAQTLPAPGPVPDAHAIRQLLLQASWKRDRWVARRRVALRWALWAARRYVLPALMLVAAVAFGWLWVLPHWQSPAIAPVASPVVAPTPVTIPAAALEPALQLRLQSELIAPGTGSAATAISAPQTKAAPSPADRFPPPTLTSDNWLHSKEP